MILRAVNPPAVCQLARYVQAAASLSSSANKVLICWSTGPFGATHVILYIHGPDRMNLSVFGNRPEAPGRSLLGILIKYQN